MNIARQTKYLLAALALVATQMLSGVAPAAANAWDEIEERGTVRIGIIAQRACYYWRDSDDEEWKGFPIRMGKDAVAALEEEMGRDLDIEWIPTNWTNLILDLQSGRMDAFFGIGITEERQRSVDMFGPIYAVPEVFLVRADSTLGNRWEDMNKPEVRIATSMGSTSEAAAREFAPDAELRLHQSGDLALLDVQSGNADVQLETAITGLAGATRAGNLKLLLLDPYTAPESGGAVRKDGEGRFRDFMQAWGEEYRSSGALEDTILAALEECGLDVDMLPEGTTF